MGRRLLPLLDGTVPVMAMCVVVGGGYFHAGADIHPVGALIGTIAALALGARLRAPVWTVAVSAILVTMLFWIDPAIAPYAMLAPAGALFSLALCGSRPRQLAGGLGALAVVVAAQVVNSDPPIPWATLHLAMLVVPILAAETLRARRSYSSAVTVNREQEAHRRAQDERLRIARDVHDVVAHTLTTINVQAAVAGHLLDTRPEHARHALTIIEDASRDAIAELRGILGVLRDPDGVAASRAPAPGLDDVAHLVELARDAGLSTRLDVSGARPERVPEAVSRAAFRIVQESLTNAARHTAGADVRVALCFRPDELAIDVENTTLAASRATPPAPGVGIIGMTERAEALGGSLRAAASDGAFLVAARLPYRAG